MSCARVDCIVGGCCDMVVVVGLALFKDYLYFNGHKSENMTLEGFDILIFQWLTTNNAALSRFPMSISQRPGGVTHNDSYGVSQI